jgi:hypothetical protein
LNTPATCTHSPSAPATAVDTDPFTPLLVCWCFLIFHLFII